MKLLAIETSASACSVALMINDNIASIHKIAPMQQATQILPMINELLQNAGLTIQDITALAFGCGPGSFTGVRIATSVMQGLAYACKLNLLPVSSLAACAQAAYENLGWQKILVAMDARMGEIYWGAYVVNAGGLMELQGEESVSPAAALTLPDGGDWYGIGNGWQAYAAQFTVQPLKIDGERQPQASGVARLGKAMLSRGEGVPADTVAPVYLRNNVAEKGR